MPLICAKCGRLWEGAGSPKTCIKCDRPSYAVMSATVAPETGALTGRPSIDVKTTKCWKCSMEFTSSQWEDAESKLYKHNQTAHPEPRYPR